MARTYKWSYEQKRKYASSEQGELFKEQVPENQLDLFQQSLNEKICQIEREKKERLAQSNLLHRDTMNQIRHGSKKR